MKDFFKELRRRHVFRVGIAYLVVAWLVIQLVNNIVPILGAPDWTSKVVLILLIAGLPIALIIAWAFELTPDGVKLTDEVDKAEPRPPAVSTSRKWDFVIIAALILALGYFTWDRYGGRATASPEPSVAVLPFKNLSYDKMQDRFADGLSEELLSKLGRIKGLQVTGSTSSFYFKGRDENLRTIGEMLGVRYLLEGGVSKDGDTLRIDARLVNAKNGYQLWSHRYDRKPTDIFAMQDEIVKAVTDALQIKLGVGELGRLPGMTRNVDAYDEYLLGQEIYTPTVESYRASIDHLEQAVRLDPNFAIAVLRLSRAYTAANIFVPGEIDNAAANARQAFDQAERLTPDSPLVYATAAGNAVTWLDTGRNWTKALKLAAKYSLERSIEPRYAVFLMGVGRIKEAIVYQKRARRAEPLDTTIAAMLIFDYASAGNTSKALAEADRAIKLPGASSQPLGVRSMGLLVALGLHDKAKIRKWLNDIVAANGGFDIDRKMPQFLDDPKAALAQLHREAEQPGSVKNIAVASYASYFGDPEFALKILQQTPNSVLSNSLPFWLPLYAEMRKLPGFKDLVRDMGLVDYWRASGNWGDYCHPVSDTDFECS